MVCCASMIRVCSFSGEHCQGENEEVYVVRMCPYSDSCLVMEAEFRELFEVTKHQNQYWQGSGARSRIQGADRVGRSRG